MKIENLKISFKNMVPGAGIEPARPKGREILSLLLMRNYLFLLRINETKLRLFDSTASFLRQSFEREIHRTTTRKLTQISRSSALIIAAFFALAMPSHISADEIHILTVSKHWYKKADRTYNETNQGLFYLKDLGSMSLIGGVYKNTYSKWSKVVGVESKTSGRFSVGGQLGIATGYEEMTGQRVSPMATLFVQYEITDKIATRVLFIPHKEGAVGFMLVLPF